MLQTYEAVLEPNGHLHFLETLPTSIPTYVLPSIGYLYHGNTARC